MNKQNSTYDIILAIAFFGGVAIFFSRPLFAISDLWWHLSSGRWLVEHMTLPQVDPFSLVPNAVAGLRESLILNGYWLAQTLFFLVYGLLGMAGLVALKSALLTAIVFFSWRILVIRGVQSFWALLVLTPLAIGLREFDELRPHLFSLLGVVLIIFLMELYLKKLKVAERFEWRLPATLVFVMIVWANMHPGFIVGNGVVVLYLGAEAFRFLGGKDGLPRRQRVTYITVCFASVLATMVNPCHLTVYRLLLAEEGVGGKFAETITEYQPVWEYFSGTGELYFFYGMLLLMLSAGIVGFVAKRRVGMVDVCLFVVFCVAGFASFRYSIFFVLSAIFLIGKGLSRQSFLAGQRAILVGKVLVVLVVVSFAAGTTRASALWRGPVALGSLTNTVAFVKNQGLPGPIFSPYELGGYLHWTLYPDYKTFVDARTLNFERYEEYRQVILGRKANVFRKYRFNTVAFYLKAPTKNQIPGLIFSLLGDKEWTLLYDGGETLVFSRLSGRNDLRSIDKAWYITSLTEKLREAVQARPGDPSPLLDLGQLFFVRKDYRESQRYFTKALKLDPQNEFAVSWMNYLNSLER